MSGTQRHASAAHRRLLAIAYHFPPIQGSSGLHRTLAFARYLPEWNWSTTVLTASPNAYASTRTENERMVPPTVDVVRALAFDTVRHLSVKGRYLRLMALPDRWQSWILTGIWKGLWTIRRQHPSVIYSTFPIASAHVIGLVLARLTGLPWVADFRDPMDQITYPTDPLVRRSYRWIENQTFRHAARVLVTTPSTATLYQKRYPAQVGKLRIIPNGFDPEQFPSSWNERQPAVVCRDSGPITLLHSGILYPKERNPIPFLRALSTLHRSGNPRYGNLRVVFRGSGHERRFIDTVAELGLQNIVSFLPALSYQEAVAEMLQADALLLFQAASCNFQIPAKVYEYLYSGRPIIGITDPDGDTGQLLRCVGIHYVAMLEDERKIESLLKIVINDLHEGRITTPARQAVMKFSRKAASGTLATLLNELVAAPLSMASHFDSN